MPRCTFSFDFTHAMRHNCDPKAPYTKGLCFFYACVKSHNGRSGSAATPLVVRLWKAAMQERRNRQVGFFLDPRGGGGFFGGVQFQITHSLTRTKQHNKVFLFFSLFRSPIPWLCVRNPPATRHPPCLWTNHGVSLFLLPRGS